MRDLEQLADGRLHARLFRGSSQRKVDVQVAVARVAVRDAAHARGGGSAAAS
jgi:hypothetical protein